MRVDQSESNVGPQLNATPGGSQSTSTFLSTSSSSQGSFGGSVAGALPLGDGGDYYALGDVLAGNTISLTTSAPSISSLYGGARAPADVVLSIEQAGSSTPVATSNTGTLTYTIPSGAAGSYYLVVQAAPNNQGIRAQYLLTADVTNSTPPTVTSTTLPIAGESTSALLNQFTVYFSESMATSAATNPANYSLSDNHGHTYALVPASYGGALPETLTITNGPIQPGSYTLNISSAITDRALNALPAYQLPFGVVQVAGYVTESESDNTPGTATPLATPTSQPDGTFSLASTSTVGSDPYSIASAALRGTGHPLDLVTANEGSNTISVLLGNGNGTFQPPVNYTVGSEPIAVAIGDLNGDGVLDIAVANYGANTISILFGNGDGTFQTPVTYTVGTNPAAIAIANLDGKNGNDLVVSNWRQQQRQRPAQPGQRHLRHRRELRCRFAPGRIQRRRLQRRWQARHCGGQLQQQHGERPAGQRRRHLRHPGHLLNAAPVPIPTTWWRWTSTATASTTWRRRTTAPTPSSVLLNQGTTGAAAPSTAPSPTAVNYAAGSCGSYPLVAADFNGDGKQDLAVGGLQQQRGQRSLGNGNGTLQAAQTTSAGGNPYQHHRGRLQRRRDHRSGHRQLQQYSNVS